MKKNKISREKMMMKMEGINMDQKLLKKKMPKL